MSLIDNISATVFTRKPGKPSDYGPDFTAIILTEVIDGKDVDSTKLVLAGSFLPRDEIELGVTQKVQKEYYPGNPEPSVQIMGAQDDDLPLKGKFKIKRLDEDYRAAAVEYQLAAEELVRRGNLLKLTIGKYVRYGFLGHGKFKFMRLQEIAYDLNFVVVGKKLPSNCKQLAGQDSDIQKPNQELIASVAAALAAYKNYPDSMPRTLGEFLNDQISQVAASIKQVTDFIDGIFQTASDVEASAARAVGLIKNARTKIAIYQRRIGSLALTQAILGPKATKAGSFTVFRYNNQDHILGSLQAVTSINTQLAALLARYKALSATIPLRRYLVKDGDTLQGLAARFYGDSEGWEKIYDHNKLTSTALTRGTVLEIPK